MSKKLDSRNLEYLVSWKYGKCVSMLKPKGAKYLAQLMSAGDIIQKDLENAVSV